MADKKLEETAMSLKRRRLLSLPWLAVVAAVLPGLWQSALALEAESWNGLFAPAKTPRDIIDRLHSDVAAAVRHPEVMKKLMDLGAVPVGSSSAEQDAVLRKQMEQFRPIIAPIKME